MIRKNLTTKDDINVVVTCTEKPERCTAYFKYEIVSVTDGVVKFRLLNSPRNTSAEGFALIEVKAIDHSFVIASSNEPATEDNTMYVWGKDTEKDSVILELPIYEFNLMQLGMLVWNISIMKHNTKIVYICCPCCSEYKEIKLPLSGVSEQFNIDGVICCQEMPEFFNINFTLKDEIDDNNIHTQFKVVVPQFQPVRSWLPNKDLYGSMPELRSYLWDKLHNKSHSKVRIAKVCPHCMKHDGWLDVQTFASTDFNATTALCVDCQTKVHSCSRCDRRGFNYLNWDGFLYCPNCVRSARCYVCQLDAPESRSVQTVIMRDSSGTTYNVCKKHHKEIKTNGWTVLKLLPELRYDWKVRPESLKVIHVEKEEVVEKPALEMLDTLPVCALEWEFPFNKTVCNTEIRDRAIWMFDDIQKEAGYPQLFIAKHDGSLPQFATEFVSNKPANIKVWHKLYFDGVLRKLAALIDASYVHAHSQSVGGHIHINRASFTKIQISKLLKFVYSNKQFMSFICGRSFSEGGYYAARTGVNPLSFAYDARITSPEKYTIARVTHNPYRGQECGTVELRAFKSPTTDVEVVQNVEFMFAIREFVKNVSGKDVVDANAFVTFVKHKRHLFPLLSEKLLPITTKFALNVPETHGSVQRKKVVHLHKCPSCGDGFYSNKGRAVCQNCEESGGTFLCQSCDEHIQRNTGEAVVTNWGTVCNDCLDDYFTRCDCGEYHRDDTDCTNCGSDEPMEDSL